jgi:hypothetical protein
LPKLGELSKQPHQIQKDWKNFMEFLYRSKPGIIGTGVRRQWKLSRRKKEGQAEKSVLPFSSQFIPFYGLCFFAFI